MEVDEEGFVSWEQVLEIKSKIANELMDGGLTRGIRAEGPHPQVTETKMLVSVSVELIWWRGGDEM